MLPRATSWLSLGIGLTLLSAACTSSDGGDDGVVDPTTGEISGAISTDQEWSGAITIASATSIEPGATVTVAPGTKILAHDGVQLRVAGTLLAEGTASQPLTIVPIDGATAWAGIVAEDGGAVRIAYASGHDVATLLYCHAAATQCEVEAVQLSKTGQAVVAEGVASLIGSRIAEVANGGVTVRGDGDLLVRDSYVLTSTGDVLVQEGGRLTIEYSEIGDAQGTFDHCSVHIGAATSVSITYSNIRAGVYGMMIGGTSNAIIQHNNWLDNDVDVDEIGDNVGVDMRFNYWKAGAPTDLSSVYDVSASVDDVIEAGPRS